MTTLRNRRTGDPTCNAMLWPQDCKDDLMRFMCTRLKGHEGPHVHREKGEHRIFGKDVKLVNFTVMWYTK